MKKMSDSELIAYRIELEKQKKKEVKKQEKKKA